MTDLFYRAFEDKFRGSRSLIISRLDIYRAFISPLKQIYTDARGLDLGCGRGEWLEVLQEEGIEPLGIDLDEGMLEACRALHLPAVKGDAVAYLAGLPNESQAVISAFHMVEHIPFEQLQAVVSESLRVLKPGGLLIMETPNPENIVVGTQNFYVDPTHQRPIPSLLLSFLPEFYGYARTKVLRLQESLTLMQNTTLGLHDVLGGVSPDYAVIAQKNATAGVLEIFDKAFAGEYGLSMGTLSAHYDAGVKGPMEHLQTQFRELEARVNSTLVQAEARVNSTLVQAERFRKNALIDEIQVQLHQAEARARQAESRAQRAEHDAQLATTALQAVYASTSWRLSAPVRWLAIQARLLRTHGLRARLSSLQKKIWLGSEGIPLVPPDPMPNGHPEPVSNPSPCAQATMSARVQKVYNELKNGVNHSPKGH